MPATNPALPVLGEQVWTSADGLGVQVRIAVHALRRISGATVLDWSVTPLKAPNLRPGDAVPPTLDLGLSRRDDQRPRIYLLDSRDDELYRPLVSATGRPRCVCTPLSPAQRRLRIGHTTLLQVAFPALPAATSAIDVVIATVPPFGQVPVTRAGHIPVAAQPTELGRPGDPAPDVWGFLGHVPLRTRRADLPDPAEPGAGQQHLHHTRVDDQVGDRRSRPRRGLESAVRRAGCRRGGARRPRHGQRSCSGRRDGAGQPNPAGPDGEVRRARPSGGERMSLQPAAGMDVGAESAGQGRHRGDDLPTASGRHRPRPGPLPRGGHHVGAGHAGAERAQPQSAKRARTSPTTWRPADLRPGPGWTSEDWPTPVPSADQLPDR